MKECDAKAERDSNDNRNQNRWKTPDKKHRIKNKLGENFHTDTTSNNFNRFQYLSEGEEIDFESEYEEKDEKSYYTLKNTTAREKWKREKKYKEEIREKEVNVKIDKLKKSSDSLLLHNQLLAYYNFISKQELSNYNSDSSKNKKIDYKKESIYSENYENKSMQSDDYCEDDSIYCDDDYKHESNDNDSDDNYECDSSDNESVDAINPH